ncbi:MAG: tRNA pseudouridine(55) synthase TruB, partial [Gemmatimonadota bacterium]
MSGDARAGLLLVDKPEGPTSHDIVDRVRRALGLRRVGHTGTLDPFATGLLILCVGWVTRLAEFQSGLPKRYRATLRLGVRTDTDDRTGRVRSRDGAWALLDRGAIEAALHARAQIGVQRVPAFSARRRGGTRLYESARRGIEVETPVQSIRIHRIACLDVSGPDVSFEVDGSAGTYVRALARDIGEDLGVGAHLTALRRLEVGAFRVEDALPPEALSDRSAVERAMRPPRDAVAHLPWVELTPTELLRFAQGQPVDAPAELAGPQAVAVGFEGRLVGIAETDDGA